jgi:hypothetical protein
MSGPPHLAVPIHRFATSSLAGQRFFRAIEDAVGDIVVYLADFCTREDFDFEAVVTQVWEKVKQRDWQRDKLTGRPHGPVV